MSMLDTWAPSLTERIAAHILYLGAIQRCCDIQLAWFIACNEAAPPSTITRTKSQDKSNRGAREIWALILVLLAIFAVIGPIVYAICNKIIIIPKWVLDSLFSSSMLFVWSILFASALYRVFPRPLTVHKSRLGEEDRWLCDFKPECSTEGYLNWFNPRVNQIAGSACAIILTYAIYSGYKSVMPISLGMGVMAYILRSNPIGATAKLRNSMFMAVLPYMGIVFVTLSEKIFPKDPSKKPASADLDSTLILSDWLLPFLFLWITTIVASMPGQFFMINMRYEHSRVSPDAIVPNSKQVSPVAIGQHEKFLPLHLVCLGTSALTFLGFDLAGYFGYKDSPWLFITSLFAVTPIVIITSAILTCLRGDFLDWCRYEETWYPKIDLSVTTEVEVNTGLEISDEKKEHA